MVTDNVHPAGLTLKNAAEGRIAGDLRFIDGLIDQSIDESVPHN
ncbi:hypothetical protein AB2B38_006860 [Balneola sp. MJW-20]